jgi:hypothetical protein
VPASGRVPGQPGLACALITLKTNGILYSGLYAVLLPDWPLSDVVLFAVQHTRHCTLRSAACSRNRACTLDRLLQICYLPHALPAANFKVMAFDLATYGPRSRSSGSRV